jgi:hypothetical protein
METPPKVQQYYVMAIAEKPIESGANRESLIWSSFVDNLKQQGFQYAPASEKCDNAWLLPQENALHHLHIFEAVCRQWGLACKVYRIHGTVELAE